MSFRCEVYPICSSRSRMSDTDILQLSCQSCSGRKASGGNASTYLEYEDNGYLKHGNILSSDVT